MKRFYKEAAVTSGQDGHGVLLDGRPLRSPAKQVLLLPSADLAAAIAAEWGAQGEEIEPAAMPLTRLASTARDRMPAARAAMIAEVAGYLGTDMLCYRAASPIELIERQRDGWQPLLDWAEEVYGTRFVVTTSVLPVAQPEAAVQGLHAVVEGLEDWPLTGVHAATTTLGSVILALALWQGRVDAETVWRLSLLEELFEQERWGRDQEAERRQEVLRRDIEAAARFLASLSESSSSA